MWAAGGRQDVMLIASKWPPDWTKLICCTFEKWYTPKLYFLHWSLHVDDIMINKFKIASYRIYDQICNMQLKVKELNCWWTSTVKLSVEKISKDLKLSFQCKNLPNFVKFCRINPSSKTFQGIVMIVVEYSVQTEKSLLNQGST